jgi:hypothetical protein
VCQAFGWQHGLHWKPAEAKRFYAFDLRVHCNRHGDEFLRSESRESVGVCRNRTRFHDAIPHLIVMRIVNNREIMGGWTNRRPMNVLGWLATAAMFAAAIGLVVTWLK